MSSPGVTPVTAVTDAAGRSRRRQRSARVTVATALLGLAVLVVAGAAALGAVLPLVLAGAAAVVLGAAATRITHAELLQSRRDANRDRAEQAQAYRHLAEERSAEHRTDLDRVVGDLTAQIAEREQVLTELEGALAQVQRQAADAQLALVVETRRADELESEGRVLVASLDAAEERASTAIVRLAELEQELLVLRAELDTVTAAWHASEARLVQRKRA